MAQPNILDILKKSKRGPATILPKDFGAIVANTGLGNGNIVVDAGAGSGWLAMQLANVVGKEGKVITYESRKEFAELSQKNFDNFGFANIKIKSKDVTRGISERNADLVCLDLQDSYKAIKHAEKALKPGGYLAVYCPQITQVIKAVNEIQKAKLTLTKVTETMERPWKVDGKVARPEHSFLSFTAFIVFARKI
ncbi:MAG TPA: methyltransferase domain-containing protein [Candidatus Nanoarchaeia archaeon]|nr:methyltransferase domain-containing protein [Candidatus Nanoarchaeia archaeon]